jgi:hypothetical protein
LVTVPAGDDTQESKHPRKNDDNKDNGHEDDEEENNEAEDEDDEDYTPLSNSEKEKMYHNADEIKAARMKLRSPPAD